MRCLPPPIAHRVMAPPMRVTLRRALLGLVVMLAAGPALAAVAQGDAAAWWLWPLALFCVCFLLGIVAVPAGIGGGVLFVPIVGGVLSVRSRFRARRGTAGSPRELAGGGSESLRTGLADLRLALPLALSASIGSVAGALIGLALPPAVTQAALGAVILGMVALMLLSRHSEFPAVPPGPHAWASLAIGGAFRDRARGTDVAWRVHRIPAGTAAFALNGLIGGIFGVGAGWANVPTLNLMMAAPLKIAVGTSSIILSLASSSAIWTYANAGAILPMVAAPAVIGIMLGAPASARIFSPC